MKAGIIYKHRKNNSFFLSLGKVNTVRFNERTLLNDDKRENLFCICKLTKSHIKFTSQEDLFFSSGSSTLFNKVSFKKSISEIIYKEHLDLNKHYENGFDLELFKQRLKDGALQKLALYFDQNIKYTKEISKLLSIYNIDSRNIKTYEDFSCLT